MKRQQSAIVVPCYNEAKRLQPEQFVEFIRAKDDFSLFFVNDGSEDETRSILHAMAAQCSGITVLDLPTNCGKAEAVRVGVLTALDSDAKYVGYWDADLATPIEEIPRFAKCLDDFAQIDMVLGCRLGLQGHDIQRRWKRKMAGRCFAFAASTVLGMRVRDTQCGAKLFRVTRELRRVFQKPFNSKWIFDVEIIARLKSASAGPDQKGLFLELPLYRWNEIEGSKIKFKDWVVAASDLVSIAWGQGLSNGHAESGDAVYVSKSNPQRRAA